MFDAIDLLLVLEALAALAVVGVVVCAVGAVLEALRADRPQPAARTAVATEVTAVDSVAGIDEGITLLATAPPAGVTPRASQHTKPVVPAVHAPVHVSKVAAPAVTKAPAPRPSNPITAEEPMVVPTGKTARWAVSATRPVLRSSDPTQISSLVSAMQEAPVVEAPIAVPEPVAVEPVVPEPVVAEPVVVAAAAVSGPITMSTAKINAPTAAAVAGLATVTDHPMRFEPAALADASGEPSGEHAPVVSLSDRRNATGEVPKVVVRKAADPAHMDEAAARHPSSRQKVDRADSRRNRRRDKDDSSHHRLPLGAEAALLSIIELAPDPRNSLALQQDPTAEVRLTSADRAAARAKASTSPDGNLPGGSGRRSA